MKKFYIANRYDTDSPERYAVYFDFDNSRFADIVGFTYLEETGGTPVTDNDQPDTLDELKSWATSEIMDTDAEDDEYLEDTFVAWGLIPHREDDEDE